MLLAMNIRAAKIASTMRRVVQELISRGLNDPRVRGLVSVTRVEVSDDLQDARVYVSIMPEEASALTMHGMRHAADHIRRRLGQAMHLRRIPRLDFRLDESIKRQALLDQALARAGLRDHADQGGDAGPINANEPGMADDGRPGPDQLPPLAHEGDQT